MQRLDNETINLEYNLSTSPRVLKVITTYDIMILYYTLWR
nr:MAG TPA: hypothetical protein [Caudoviricetes sp.]